MWLIDEHDLTLYRKLASGKEQVIPIPKNKSIRKFMCVSDEEFFDMVVESLEKGAK